MTVFSLRFNQLEFSVFAGTEELTCFFFPKTFSVPLYISVPIFYPVEFCAGSQFSYDSTLAFKVGRKGRNCIISLLLFPDQIQNQLNLNLCILTSSCQPLISNIEYRKSSSQRKFRTMHDRIVVVVVVFFFQCTVISIRY